MTTTDTVLLAIVAILMSLYFLLGSIATVMVIKLLTSVRRIVEKAEHVVDSVETAADVLKDTSGRLAIFKLIKNIINLGQRKK